MLITPTSAQGQPEDPGGNVACPVGYESYKIDGINSSYTGGVYNLDGGYVLKVVAYDNAKYFDWESMVGIYRVHAKGSNDSNIYEYNPKAYEDTGLHAPYTPGGPLSTLSNIVFCYRHELQVKKTADTYFKRTWTWDIEKWGETKDLGTGLTTDLFEVKYELTLTPEKKDSDYKVSGLIHIYNPSPHIAYIDDIKDVISKSGEGDINGTVECGGFTVFSTIEIQPKNTLVCEYSATLLNSDERLNTAIVKTKAESMVEGGYGTKKVVFSETPSEEIDEEIKYYDDRLGGYRGTINANSYPNGYKDEYDLEFRFDECGKDEFINKAWLKTNDTKTVEKDSWTVAVDILCELIVDKTVETYFERLWTWDIDKWGSEELIIDRSLLDTEYPIDYKVKLSAEPEDMNFLVKGTITIENPSKDYDAIITDIEDIIAYGAGIELIADLECQEEYVEDKIILGSEETLTCEYLAELTDGYPGLEGLNTATVTTDEESMVLSSYVEKDVEFPTEPTKEIDEEVDVDDDQYGVLGTVKASDLVEGMYIFPYQMKLLIECGEYTFTNTASFLTNDNEETGSDSWDVDIDIACILACTYTQGYWKTHSSYGPAPYDMTWGLISEDTTFFLSGQSYYKVINSSPKGGNAYYVLAQQYIAAELNGKLIGSYPSNIQTAMDEAETLFETYTPAQILALKAKSPVRSKFISLAGLLDSYNNVLEGVPHCE